LGSRSNILALIFKCIQVDTHIEHLHGNKKVGFHTFECGEKLDLKTTSEFKTTSFELEKEVEKLQENINKKIKKELQ
jgi:transcription initiation factor IIE alpha subunit